MARGSEDPLAFYLLKSIFEDIAHEWEGEAVSVPRSEHLQLRVLPSMIGLLDAIEGGASSAQQLPILSELVYQFLNP
jgi:hypothetical protein